MHVVRRDRNERERVKEKVIISFSVRIAKAVCRLQNAMAAWTWLRIVFTIYKKDGPKRQFAN